MKKILSSFLVIVFLLNLPVGSTNSYKVEANWFHFPHLEAHFINVGQGDSILVVLPNGKKMLIDGGPRESGPKIVDYLRKHLIKELDLVVSTHPDADHIGGLLDVLQYVKVNKVLDSGKLHTTDTYREYLQLIRSHQIPIEIAKEGQSIDLDKKVKIQIMNSNNADQENNEASIVLKMTLGKIDYLLAADAEEKSELEMVSSYHIDSEIIKIGHHGSITSSTEEFLQSVEPEVAILSFGKENPYGHPHKEVIERLKDNDIKMFSTADYESVIVKTNGRSYKVFSKIQDKNGQLSAIEPQTYKGNLAITELDLKKEKVTIKNNRDQDVLMMGWKIISEAGNQIFQFPPDFVLKAGESVSVYSTSKPKESEKDKLWWLDKTKIWNDIGDRAFLYSPNGGLADYESKK
ncbi:lamin tail domain-containing protein [Bacillus pinisoli]|uniref:lamin tail domain-containing protein n=1 Tax=Bacillus pinisoli TaxID=2901866 RepID=UPI001FF1394C|nr:lamin tail domain-containing protein [Bacillus pinisoli]